MTLISARKYTKRKKKSLRNPQPAGSKTFKEAFGGAIGAGLGSLVGAAIVRNPKMFNKILGDVVEIVRHPNFPENLTEILPKNEWATAKAAAPCPAGTPGCVGPDLTPKEKARHDFFMDECDRVQKRNPTWGIGRVTDEAFLAANKKFGGPMRSETMKKRRAHAQKKPASPPAT